MSQSYYETAQICLNGHVTTSGIETSPESAAPYCPQCGSKTITQCQHCQARIRGYYMVPGVIAVFEYHKPSFCHNCGNPFPWTEQALEAAKELALEEHTLNPEERQQLADSLNDLVRDTPRTQLAATRFKRLIGKATSATASALRDIMVDIASETAKKAIFPAP